MLKMQGSIPSRPQSFEAFKPQFRWGFLFPLVSICNFTLFLQINNDFLMRLESNQLGSIFRIPNSLPFHFLDFSL